MTLSTKLTVLRIGLTFVVMALLFVPGWVAKAIALAAFLFASLTDWADGYLARRWHQTTPLGALLDPLADKILVLGIFLVFVQLRLAPAWMVLVIVVRESLITGMRLVAAGHHVVLSAERTGKHKTVSQMAAIAVILSVVTLQEWLGRGVLSLQTVARMHQVTLGCLWVAVALTVISGASFFWRHRDVLRMR